MKKLRLEELIVKRMNELNLSNRDIVIRMGYTNIDRGLIKFIRIKQQGWLPSKEQIEFLIKGLEVDKNTIIDAMNETMRLQDIEREKKEKEIIAIETERFKPYILSIHERRVPEPIFVGAMTDHQRYIYFDKSFLNIDEEKQFEIVGECIKEHIKKNKGGLPGFGWITHYVLRRAFIEEHYEIPVFNTDGSLMKDVPKDIRKQTGTCSLMVKNRDITHLFNNKTESN